jgi:hypothetical protein
VHTGSGREGARPRMHWRSSAGVRVQRISETDTGGSCVGQRKIDRPGRSLRDLVDIVATLEARGVGVKSLTNGVVAV